ncbi:hypothetical protein [Clostridium novyi]|uniref:HIRAN domain-containing protein n=1 Tax=Clostridium novyi B str. ATCC 27606 TaxID=1443123 RepID=A0AA40IRG9_CLONO|nr:hypothetical protein [Clostridium novyi]KEI11461.1 hypothetical protein Z959_p0024 [Clostridium novyi B str. ATCC 27606]
MFKFLKKVFNNNIKNNIKTYEYAFDTTNIPENFDLKYEFKNARVNGVQYSKPDKTKLKHDVVDLVFEKNKFDKYAVKVIQNGIKLGYLARYEHPKILTHIFHKEKGLVIAKLKRINIKTMNIDIFFYDNKNKIYNNVETKLTKTTKKDEFGISRQQSLEYVQDGDKLTVSYNFKTETYEVLTEFKESVGELTKSLSKKLYNLNIPDSDIFCCITNKSDKEDSKIYTADLIVSYIIRNQH